MTRLHADLRLGIVQPGTNVLLLWTNQDATLEHSLVLTSDWTTVTGAISPHPVTPTNPASFYRLRAQSSGGPFDFRYVAPTFTTGIGDPTGCGCTAPENPNSLSTGGSAQDNGSGSVFLHTGEVTQHAVDLEIPGRGFNWRFERRCRSGMSYDGPLGYGWEFNYNRRLAVQPNGDALRADGLGRVDRYVLNGGAYQSPSGFYTRLARNPDGTFEERDRHGTVHSYSATNGLGTARLTSIRDRNGNEMTFDYNTFGQLANVFHTLGRSIAYAYDANGRLTLVTDFAGRVLQFGYDAEGNLTSVTSPAVTGTPNGNDFPLGKTTRYTYSSGYGDSRFNHNLLTVTAPNEVALSGPARLVAEYDTDPGSTNADRVVALTLGGTNASGIGAGGTIAYAYTNLGAAPPNDLGMVVSITTVTNRNGNASEYCFNSQFNVVQYVRFTKGLRPGEPAGFTNTFAYNGDGEMIRRTNAELDTVEYTFDSANPDRFQQGNLLQMLRRPGPRAGSQPQIVTSYTYETNLNLVATATDGRGHTTRHTYDERGNRTNTIHRLPSITEAWEYNAFGQVTAHVLPDNGSGHRRRDEFSYYASAPQTGYLQSQVVDSGGFSITTTYEYDAVGNVTRVVDPRGNDTLYTVNTLNQVVLEQSRPVDTTNGPIRYQRDWFYDDNDNVVRTEVENRDENGLQNVANPVLTTTYGYDILDDRLATTQEVDVASSVVTAYAYDANQNRTLIHFGEATAGRDPFNTAQTFYDERDFVFRVTRALGSADQSTTQTDYDGNGNVVRVAEGIEDNGGHATTNTYDGFDRRLTTTDPMGNVTRWHYNPNGSVMSQRVEGELTDVPGSAGNVRLSEMTYQYDFMDRRVRSDVAHFDPQTQTPIGDGWATTETIYSDNSQVLAKIDDNNHGRTNSYDSANRLATTLDPRSNSVSYAYDPNGNLTNKVEVDKSDLGNPDVTITTRYTYDGLDRRIGAIDNLNHTDSTAYDSRNNFVAITDRRGNLTRYTYDGLDRRIRAERLMTSSGTGAGAVIGSIVTSQTWDDSSRLAAQTDGNTDTTTYAYDSLDRRIRTVLADDTCQTNVFDVHGNSAQFRDANGSVVTSRYDANDRLITNLVVRAAGVVGTTNEVYQYDGLGRLVSARNQDAQITRAYDSLGSLTRETQQLLPGGPVRTVLATNDGVGNLTQLVYPGGGIVTNAYDELNRLASISSGSGLLANFSYIGPVNPKRFGQPEEDGGGGKTPSGPDDIILDGLISPGTKIEYFWGARAPAAPPPPSEFSSDDPFFGRVEQRQLADGTITHYQYDPLRRLTNILGTNILTSSMIEDRILAWDAVNNKVTDSSLAGPTYPDSRNYQYDSANRLFQSHMTAGGSFTNIDYFLDNADNRTNVTGAVDPGFYTLSPALPEPADYQVNQYTTTPFDSRTYDRNGNLKSSGVGTFAYNFRNQLVQVTNLGLTNKYDCLGRRLEKIVAGTVTRFYYFGTREIEEQTAANATAATFVWSGRAGNLLRMTLSNYSYFYHSDDLGRVRKVTDVSGNVVEQYDYGDYGKPLFYDGTGTPLCASAVGNTYFFSRLAI